MRKRDQSARRRKKPPATKGKLNVGQAEVALARNAAELQARIAKSQRQVAAHMQAADRFEAQKAVVMKVAEELIEAGEIDRDIFESLLQSELDDLGIAEGPVGEAIDDGDEEDGE